MTSPWSWPRNLYLVVRLMFAVSGTMGSGAAGAGVAWAKAPAAPSDRNEVTRTDFFFIEAPWRSC